MSLRVSVPTERRRVHDPTVSLDAVHTDERLPLLAAALVRLGVTCALEVHGTAVLLTPTGADPSIRLVDPARRRELVTLVRGHGFTHVALLLGDG
jgi:hypothetical protein